MSFSSLLASDLKDDDEWEDCSSGDSVDDEVEEEALLDVNMVRRLLVGG